MRIATVGPALLVLLISAQNVQSQERIPQGTALGITVDRFYFDSEYFVYAATFHVSAINSGKLTPEFAVSLFPQALVASALATNLDVGGAINLPLPYATVLLRGGASGFLVAGGGGAIALPGAHYGASLLVKIGEKSGIRFDLLRRIYFLPYEFAPAILTVGVGITSLPGIH